MVPFAIDGMSFAMDVVFCFVLFCFKGLAVWDGKDNRRSIIIITTFIFSFSFFSSDAKVLFCVTMEGFIIGLDLSIDRLA